MIESLETEVPRIKTIEELQKYINPVYIIEKYTTSPKEYKEFISRIRNIVRGCIDIQRCREYPINFKFYKEEKGTHIVQLRQFLYNICIWYPFSLLHELDFMDESYIMTAEVTPKVNNFVDRKILSILRKNNVKDEDINKYGAEVTYLIGSISIDFSLIMGLHYDERTFQTMYEDPEYRDMMELKIEDSEMQPIEIEEHLKNVENKMLDKIRADKKNPFNVLVNVGTGMKSKQLVEFMIMVGLRPTLDNEVVTYPINNSFLINGLNKPSYMFIDALGARKPLLVNNKDMGTVGYFCKTLNLATRSLEISTKQIDCGTNHTVNYIVKSKAHLNLLRGKYIYDEDMDDFKLIDTSDLSLVGKTVKARSVITCCCGENHVCPTCVGEIINYNYDIAHGFGVFITEEWSKDVEQNTLSTKHLLVTVSERIEFSDTFKKFFKLEGEEIKLLDGLKDIKDLSIYVNPDEIKKVEELDPNSTYNTYIETGRFYIINTKTGESQEVSVKNDKVIFIRTESSTLFKQFDGYLPLKEVEEDQPIFEISINNNPLTKPFHELISLLDSENRKGMDEVTIDTISQRVLDLFVEGKLDVPIAGAEFILNRICRRPDNVMKRPNFGKRKMPKYKFYGLSKVVENNESVTTGMSFEQLQRQFTNLLISERNGTGFYDPMFKEDVDMTPIFKYMKEVDEDIKNGISDD